MRDIDFLEILPRKTDDSVTKIFKDISEITEDQFEHDLRFLAKTKNMNILEFYASSSAVLKEHGISLAQTLNSVIVYRVECASMTSSIS